MSLLSKESGALLGLCWGLPFPICPLEFEPLSRRRYPQATAADQRYTVSAMQVAERKTRHRNFISPYTARRSSHPHSDRSGQGQITLNVALQWQLDLVNTSQSKSAGMK